MRVNTTEDYLEKAIRAHGNRFDYSRTIYVNSNTEIVVGCRDHGYFSVMPVYHLRGSTGPNNHPIDQRAYGCKSCGVENRRAGTKKRKPSGPVTHQEFLSKALKAHGEKYSYEKTIYLGSASKVVITCQSHGDFLLTPLEHTYRGKGCKICSKELRLEAKKENFIKYSCQKHKNYYSYEDMGPYINGHTEVVITCPVHGNFLQTPERHTSGRGCRPCNASKAGLNRRVTLEDFLAAAKKLHGDKFDYSKVIYSTMHESVTIVCPIHGEFSALAKYHLSNAGCYSCGEEHVNRPAGASWIANQWLDELGVISREVKLPGLTFIADGYDAEENTVYEFYGCFWHGCLTCQLPEKLNGVLRLTTEELNEKTALREDKITQAGFKVVKMWECDYRERRLANGLPVKPAQLKA